MSFCQDCTAIANVHKKTIKNSEKIQRHIIIKVELNEMKHKIIWERVIK